MGPNGNVVLVSKLSSNELLIEHTTGSGKFSMSLSIEFLQQKKIDVIRHVFGLVNVLTNGVTSKQKIKLSDNDVKSFTETRLRGLLNGLSS